jgi:hypothetical protein
MVLVRCAVAIAGLVWIPAMDAQADQHSRDGVEAAYLYNFGKFVRWPEAPGQAPLRICIAGQSALGQALAHLVTGEHIGDRRLEVRILDRVEDAASCSILYVGAAERTHQDEYLAMAAGKPVLTVGDSPDFLTRGGMIQFVMAENRVRFSVNLSAANRSGLSLSSELLKVAVSVLGGSGSGGAP